MPHCQHTHVGQSTQSLVDKAVVPQGLDSDSPRAASFSEAQQGPSALGSAVEDVGAVDPPEEVTVPQDGPSSQDYEPPTAGVQQRGVAEALPSRHKLIHLQADAVTSSRQRSGPAPLLSSMPNLALAATSRLHLWPLQLAVLLS